MARPPGPAGWAGRRRVLAARRDPLGFLVGLAREYGDVAMFRAGPFRGYLFSHPNDIREVLVTHSRSYRKGQGLQEAKRILGEGLLTSEGELHRRQRRLINPLFHHGRIAAYAEVMTANAERLSGRWADGQTLDVHEQMTRLTLSVVAKTLFDTDLDDTQAARVRRALTAALELFDRLTLPFGGLLMSLPTPATRRFVEAKRTLDGVIYGLIRERRATGDRGDLLSMLLAAEDREGDGTRMTDLQIRDEAMTIFLAGHETTANALSWTWYLLSRSREAEAKLNAEVDEVLGGRLPTADDVGALPYTRRVLTEAMRLYPPAWVIGRRALQDVDIGGYRLPTGTIAVMSPWIVHHDPRWFPNPDRFDPDRWTEELRAGLPKLAYFPFGAGPRICIGEGFAWMEGILILATLARRWRFRSVDDRPAALEPRITLRPRGGLPMSLRARESGG